jgi:hypothetical protein
LKDFMLHISRFLAITFVWLVSASGIAVSLAQTGPPEASYTIVDAGTFSQHWVSWVGMNAQGHLTSQTSGNQASFFVSP